MMIIDQGFSLCVSVFIFFPFIKKSFFPCYNIKRINSKYFFMILPLRLRLRGIIFFQYYNNNFDYFTFFLLIIILYHILREFERKILSNLFPEFHQDGNNKNYSTDFQCNINNYCHLAHIVNPPRMWYSIIIRRKNV